MIQHDPNLWFDDRIEWFDNLLATYEGPLKSYCRRNLRSGDDVDDIVQDVFVVAFRESSLLMSLPEDRLRPWLYRTAWNKMSQHFRKLRRRRELNSQEFDPTEKEELGPQEIAERNETIENLHKVFEALSPEEESLVRLTHFDKLPLYQIMEILEVTEAALKKRQQRVIDRLRKILGFSETPSQRKLRRKEHNERRKLRRKQLSEQRKLRRKVLSEQANNDMPKQSENE